MKSTKQKVWIFSFEFAGVIKVGGLGEVPANQAKHLADKYDITVFMPSHGQVERLGHKGDIKKLSINYQGKVNTREINQKDSIKEVSIDFYKYHQNDVDIILVSGNNNFARQFLEDPTVYNPDTIKGKIALFSLAMRFLMSHYIMNEPLRLPDVIHLHDYHVVIPFFTMKQMLYENNLYIPSIITIHLLTWPRFEKNYYKTCGISNKSIGVRLKNGLQHLNLDQIFKLSKDLEGFPTVEKIGAIICDMVTTVSKSYLKSHIVPNCGEDLIEFKSDFLWDGCDWDYEDLFPKVIENHGEEVREFLKIPKNSEITREHLKEYLLVYKLGNLDESPLISSPRILKEINEISNGNPFIRNGRIKAFRKSGALILTTGRISPQKGFEIIFQAVPDVIKVIPDAKFLFLMLPTDYSLREIKLYSEFVKNYPENIRIIFGVASDIFYLAHIASDVYCAPSRWEPFGIMALEAMASKVPVIATRVGGLQETVLDIRENPINGTGILVDKDDELEFRNALISILMSVKMSLLNKNDIESSSFIDLVPDEKIKKLLLEDNSLYLKIKENCLKRVRENFTWEIVSEKLDQMYYEIQEISI